MGDSSFRETNPATASGQGIIAPPPLDPLDGLEVIVGGTFTVGKLQMVPSRQFRLGQNMFDNSKDEFIPPNDEGSVTGVLNPTIANAPQEEEEEDDVEKALIEAEKAQAEAKAAAEETKRKEAKMEMLKKRAEEAMARRKEKKAK